MPIWTQFACLNFTEAASISTKVHVVYRQPPASGTGGASSNPLGGRSKSDMRLARVLGGPSRRPAPSTASPVTQEKIIVFSQWTSMLDLIEIALKQEK